jgi:predicted NBD/HSP70 family sugar kinase
VNGAPLRGISGYAGEFGHTLVRSDGVVCHCGAVGCLETEVRRSTLLDVVGLSSEDADELETALVEAAASPDAAPAVLAEVNRQIDTLAVTLRNAINTLNPQRPRGTRLPPPDDRSGRAGLRVDPLGPVKLLKQRSLSLTLRGTRVER